MGAFERILVPSDFSAGSYAALGYATVLAQRLGAVVEVLAVAEPPAGIEMETRVLEPGAKEPRSIARVIAAGTEEKLDRFLIDPPGGKGVEIERRVLTGNPAQTIVRVAREDSVDLICMGTRGLGEGAEGAMGSVLAKVVRDAPCPVMAVRVSKH